MAVELATGAQGATDCGLGAVGKPSTHHKQKLHEVPAHGHLVQFVSIYQQLN